MKKIYSIGRNGVYEMFRFIIMVVLLFACTWVFADVEPKSPQIKQFVSISDIHFDPLSGCELYKSPCPILLDLMKTDYKAWDTVFEKYTNNASIKFHRDTNYTLFKSSLLKLQQIATQENPQFVLVLGDFLDHRLLANYKKWSNDKSNKAYMAFVKKTMQYLMYSLNQTFATINIYPALGNVDTYGSDYSVIPYGEFLRDMTEMGSVLIKDPINRARFIKEFPKAGYYSVDITQTTKIIVLDTVLFSPRSQNRLVRQAAQEELQWLKSQLKIAKSNHQFVLIACHIPVGIDIYLSWTLPYKIIKNFWLPSYTKEFLSIVQQYSDSISGVVTGHVHVDLFQFTIEGEHNKHIPMIITPSISPIFGNNPAIKVFNYDADSFQLQNFERYYKSLTNTSSDWRKGNRLNSIHQADCHYCYLSDVVQHLVVNNYLLNFITRYYSGNQDIESDDNDWISYYWCSMYANDIRKYKNCLNE